MNGLRRWAIVRNGYVEKIFVETFEIVLGLTNTDLGFSETDIVEKVDLDEIKQAVQIGQKYDHNTKRFL